MRPLGAGDPPGIGPYRLLGVLGAGGMGKVYLGRSAGGRTVAVKVVRPELADDTGFRRRFAREVAAARRVGGDHTVPLLDAETEGEFPWLATAYVAGPSLRDAVDEHGPLPEPALRVLTAGLARALVAVHAAGVVHRDLKPSNVLLTVDGPRVIDFGIARATDDSVLTETGNIIGTPGFMSPEQVTGDGPVGPPGDVFALAAVVVYAATGTGPYGDGPMAAKLFRVLHQPADVSGVPEALRPLLTACFAADPAARPAPAEIVAAVSALGPVAAAGWLPPSILEQVSRAAVSLLDLDTDPALNPPPGPTVSARWPGTAAGPGVPAGADGRSGGPVGWTTPPAGYRGPSASTDPDGYRSVPATPRPGAAGPASGAVERFPSATEARPLGADASAGSAPASAREPERSHTTSHGAPGGDPVRPQTTGVGAPGRWSYPPAAQTDPAAATPTLVPARSARARRRPVGLIAAVVGVLVLTAAIAVGGGVWLSQRGSAGPAMSAPPPSAPGAAGSLPDGYAGTWTGDGSDGLATFAITVTLRAGEVGSEVGTSSNTGALSGSTCARAETLTAVADTNIVLTARLTGGANCMDDGQTSTLSLRADGTLGYVTPSPIGSIRATLRRN